MDFQSIALPTELWHHFESGADFFPKLFVVTFAIPFRFRVANIAQIFKLQKEMNSSPALFSQKVSNPFFFMPLPENKFCFFFETLPFFGQNDEVWNSLDQ